MCRPGALAGWPLGSGLAKQVTGALGPAAGGPGGEAGSQGHRGCCAPGQPRGGVCGPWGWQPERWPGAFVAEGEAWSPRERGLCGAGAPLGGGFLSSGPLLLCRKPSLPPGPVPLRRAPGPSAPPLPCSRARSRHVCVWQARCRCERGRVTGPACRRLAPGIYSPTGGLLGLLGPRGRQVGAGWSFLHPDPEALAGRGAPPWQGAVGAPGTLPLPFSEQGKLCTSNPVCEGPGGQPVPTSAPCSWRGRRFCPPLPQRRGRLPPSPPGISGVVAHLALSLP